MAKPVKMQFPADSLAAGLSSEEILTALNTLAEMVSEGHNADLSERQREVSEKVYELWVED